MTQSGSQDHSELASSKPHKLFVTGLDGKSELSTLEAELRKKFSKYGQLVSVVVKKSYNYEYSYAFIDFKQTIDATPAMKQQNNSSIFNSKITVTIQDNSRRKKGVNNTCYSCGKPGHFARDCNNKEKSPERSSSKRRSRDKKKKKRKHSSDYSRSRSHSQRKKCKEKLRVNDRKKETFEITEQKAFQEQEIQEIKTKKRLVFRLNDLLKHTKSAPYGRYKKININQLLKFFGLISQKLLLFRHWNRKGQKNIEDIKIKKKRFKKNGRKQKKNLRGKKNKNFIIYKRRIQKYDYSLVCQNIEKIFIIEQIVKGKKYSLQSKIQTIYFLKKILYHLSNIIKKLFNTQGCFFPTLFFSLLNILKLNKNNVIPTSTCKYFPMQIDDIYLFVFYIPPMNQDHRLDFIPLQKLHNQFPNNQHIDFEENNQQNVEQNLQNQEKQRNISSVDSKKDTDVGRKKNKKNQGLDYNPRERKIKIKGKIVYEKDKQRNILPNALSKLFFFLKSKTKSQSILKKFLIKNQNLSLHVTTFKFYTYMNIIKSKLSRSLNQQSLEILFSLNDPQFSIFTLAEQLSFIKIIAGLSRFFLKNQVFVQLVNNSAQMRKDKIYSYLKKYRIIEMKIQECIYKSKQRYNFKSLKTNS